MTKDEALTPIPPPEFAPYSDPPQINPVNPLLRLHLLLYGRYRWAIALGIVLGLGAALAAWFAMPPKYEVIGSVQIKPYVPPVLNVTDQNGMLPMFETFVTLQASLLQSQRILDQASQSPDWKALGQHSARWGQGINADELTVDHPRSSELVTVGYTDRNADVAAVAVKAILQAYQTTSGDIDGANDAHRLQVLEDLRTNLGNQKRGISDQILALANPFGSDDLENQYEFKLEEQNSLESELERIAVQISIAEAAVGEAATGGTSSTKPAPSTPPARRPEASSTQSAPISIHDVAKVDAQMRDDLAEESTLSLRLNQLRLRFGDEHPLVVAARSNLQAVENQINTLLAAYRAQPTTKGGTSVLRDPASGTAPALEELRTREANIRVLFDKVQTDAKTLGQQDLKIRALKDQRDTVSRKLAETTSRIDEINLEATTSNRISVLSYGDRPTAPVSNKRIPLTVALGLLGLAAGAGLVALRGFADRRVRCLLQMEQLAPTIPVLGVLPVLPDDFADPTQISDTAHCVHQIRNLLDAVHTHEVGRVLAVTSPSPGDGKTSLTLALGLSFAVSGSRTLLIDCDMVGGGLTRRLNVNVHRRLRSILRREGLITAEQLEEAVRAAGAAHKNLAETLIDLGYVTAEDMHQARADQAKTSVGLLDTLDGDPLAACVTSVLTKDLFILPMGRKAGDHNGQISVKALRRVVKEARNRFDYVLIDTGPILGSIEASVAACVADEVLLAITRGASSPLITRVMKLLESQGARLGGVVFNRATAGDVAYSQYGSSGSLRSFRSSDGERRSKGDPHSSAGSPPRLGPLASAIVTAANGSVEHVLTIPTNNGSNREGSVDINGSTHGPFFDPGSSGSSLAQEPNSP